MERILLVLIVTSIAILIPSQLTMAPGSSWVIWNVGQGEWITHITNSHCTHFDMGGEKFPRDKIRKVCGQKTNSVYFSHWDMDHIGFAKFARSLMPKLCLAAPPIGESTPKKQKLFEGWSKCDPDTAVSVWKPFLPEKMKKKKSANELCQIFVSSEMLIPGDAPSKEEEIYVEQNPKLKTVKWLVLGHHGSRTSSSVDLLRALPNLKMAIASARRAKYGHPHIETEMKLRSFHIAMLKTEDWGNIEIEE